MDDLTKDKINEEFANLSMEEQGIFITSLLDQENIIVFNYESLQDKDGNTITLTHIKNNIGWEINKRDKWEE